VKGSCKMKAMESPHVREITTCVGSKGPGDKTPVSPNKISDRTDTVAMTDRGKNHQRKASEVILNKQPPT
jgi:hypothetical protein